MENFIFYNPTKIIFGTGEEARVGEEVKKYKNRLENFYKDIGLPTRLNEVNIPNDRFEEMAEKCVDRGPSVNFVKLNKRDIISIYKIAE